MKEQFEDPCKIKNQKPPYAPIDGKNDVFWDFRSPQYDQRHSCFVKAGTNYGEGHIQPIGHKSKPKSEVSALPVRTVKTKRLDYGQE